MEIKKFPKLTGELSTYVIDEDEVIETDHTSLFSENPIANHNIIELKGNFIPKGLVPLERLFSKDDTWSSLLCSILKKMLSTVILVQKMNLRWLKFLKLFQMKKAKDTLNY